MLLILTIHELSICICLYQANKNPNSIVGDLKQLVWGSLFKKKKLLEWLSARRLLKGAGLIELLRKQLSNISAGIWPWSPTKFTLRSSAFVINNANTSIIEALLSGIKALQGPNTS